jgi:murein DD-endopeptidase MepM/ murein hydrolase activator NlpD
MGFSLPKADVDRLLREAVAQERRGMDGRRLSAWLEESMNDVFFSFAPLDAKHDDSARYRLPFRPHIPRFMGQGVGGTISHTGRDRYSFDFSMPIGEPIVAARGGTVARVVDGFEEWSIDPKKPLRGNEVYVLHDDGTFAIYVHLHPGIPVGEGQRVAKGEIIGRNGQTGRAQFPHVHFTVHRRASRGSTESVPIRFRSPKPEGMVPQPGKWYGSPPKANARLQISGTGAPIPQDEWLELPRGGSVQLGVDVVDRSGRAKLVTAHPKTVYGVLTLFNLDVTPTGQLFARPTPGFEHSTKVGRKRGRLIVIHGERDDPVRAVRIVHVAIVD